MLRNLKVISITSILLFMCCIHTWAQKNSNAWELSRKDSIEFKAIDQRIELEPETVRQIAVKKFKKTGNHRWKIIEVQALRVLGKNERALKVANDGIKSAEKVKDYFSSAALMIEMANFHNSYGDSDAAYLLFERAHKVSSLKEIKSIAVISKVGMIGMKIQMDETLDEVTEWEEGLNYLKNQGFGEDPNRYSLESNLGRVLFANNRPKEAIPHFLLALSYFENNGMYKNATHASNGLGVSFMELNQLDSANYYLNNALESARKNGSPLLKSNVYQNLGELFQRKRELEQALFYKDSAFHYYQSYREGENATIIENHNLRYDIQNKELEKSKAQQRLIEEKSNNQRIVFIACIILLLGLLIGYIIFRRFKRQSAELNGAITKLELQALRAQMNPHFIFNCLNSIQYLFIRGEIESANTYLSKFSILVRDILEQSRRETISLEQEVRNLRLYCELENFQFQDEFDYEIQMDPNITPSLIDIPIMLFQPFVENAINHGIKNLEKSNGKLIISFKIEAEELIASIKDNGVGRRQTAKNKSKEYVSRSGEITRERIDLLKKSGRESINLKIYDWYENDSAKGTKVVIRIKL